MTVDVEPEVVMKPQFNPKTCKGCGKEFTPTVGFQKFCDHCRTDKERTKRSRKRVKEKAAREADRLENLTRDEFWATNRRKLKQTQLTALEERQEQVFDTLHWMDAWLEDRYDVKPEETNYYLGLEEGTADLMADVKAQGTCNVQTILIPFWKSSEKDFRESVIACGGATETFVRYGFITAIPGHKLHAWEQKFSSLGYALQKPSTNPTMKPEGAMLVCANASQCGDHGMFAPQSIVTEYAERHMKYLCHNCLAVERASRAQSTLVNAGQERNKIFDSYGRVDHWRKDL